MKKMQKKKKLLKKASCVQRGAVFWNPVRACVILLFFAGSGFRELKPLFVYCSEFGIAL